MVNLVGGAPVQPLLNEVYRKAADDVIFRQCRQIVCMLGVGGGGKAIFGELHPTICINSDWAGLICQ